MAPLTDLTKGFKAILKRAGTPQEFADWLKTKKLYQPLDLYLLAVDETHIDKKILHQCKSEVKDVMEPAIEVAVRKAWMYCKQSTNDPGHEEKKEFDPNECSTLDAAWDAQNTIRLTTRERVGKTLLKKLHGIAHSEPPDFEIILLEQITLYCMSSTSVQQVKVANDGTVQAQQMAVAAVTTGHAVIDRITALLYSFAYVSADLVDWCRFNDARECVQEIWGKMQHAEKHGAPVSFYNDAYLATCQVWQTQIVTCSATLSTAMKNKASWVAFWDYQCPGCPQCPGWKGGKGGKGIAAQAIDTSNRQQRRSVQDAIYKTLERYDRTRGFPGYQGGKAGGKKDTRKHQYDKSGGKSGGKKGDWNKGKGKGDWNKGDGKGEWSKGEWGKGKGKDKKRDRPWY